MERIHVKAVDKENLSKRMDLFEESMAVEKGNMSQS